jgi:hypothetical protein
LLYRWRAKKLATIIPTIAPNTIPPTLDPTTTPTETPDPESEERHASVPGPPLCRGPLVHERPSASVRLIKKGVAQVRETVQFMALMSGDSILYGGWFAGATIIVYGGRPFFGSKEMSEH